MSAGIFALVLLAALLHASWNIIVKGGGRKLFETGLTALGAFMGACCLLPFLPLPAAAAWPFLGLSCLCHFLYYLCLAAAYAQADLSFSYTLMRGCAPLLTALAAGLLGAPLSACAWGGVAAIGGGILLLAGSNWRQGMGGRPVWLSLRTSLCIMAYTLADGLGAQRSGDGAAYACWLFAGQFVPITFWLCWRYGREYLAYARRRLRPGVAGGLASLASYGIAIWAMTRAPIAVVGALRETSVVFGLLLAVLFLGERLSAARLLAALLVAGGAGLLRWA